MVTSSNSENHAASIAEVSDQAADVLLSFSIPLYLLVDERPWLCGTGFIVRTPNGHFLVSAAHVLDDAKEGNLFFYSAGNKLRAVHGPLLRSSSRENRNTDPFDIAVVRLFGGEMPPFAEVNKQQTRHRCLLAMSKTASSQRQDVHHYRLPSI